MSATELFRALLEDQDIPYEVQDSKTRFNTYLRVTLNGEEFEAEFDEPLDGTPGTIGAMRELTFTSLSNITAEQAFDVIAAVVSQ